jgi:hypothetical protein
MMFRQGMELFSPCLVNQYSAMLRWTKADSFHGWRKALDRDLRASRVNRNDPPKPSKTKDEGAGIGVALMANSNGFKLHLVSILRTDPVKNKVINRLLSDQHELAIGLIESAQVVIDSVEESPKKGEQSGERDDESSHGDHKKGRD